MSYCVGFLRDDATLVPEVRSPTVRRRELGALLRKLRTVKGLTVKQDADYLMVGEQAEPDGNRTWCHAPSGHP
jgi:hypothetical protein